MSQVMMKDTFGILGYELMYFTSTGIEIVDPSMTVAYTTKQTSYRVVNGEQLSDSIVLHAYNRSSLNKVVASISMTAAGTDAVKDPLTFDLIFNVYAHDYYSEFQDNTITPPQLGIFKDAFGFDNVPLAYYAVKYKYAGEYLGQPIYSLNKLDVKMFHYDSAGRRLEDQRMTLDGGTLAEGFWILQSTVDNLVADFTNMDIATATGPLTAITWRNIATQYLKLDRCILYFRDKTIVTYSGGDNSQSSYQTVTAVSPVSSSPGAALPIFDPPIKTYEVIPQPIERLPRIGSFEQGSYQKIPLGSSPQECAARKLGLTYNNIYGLSGASDIGVVQILGWLEQDLSFVFNLENPSANYNDLSTLYAAVQGFSYPRASYIAKYYGLTYHWIPYISAVMNAIDFDAANPLEPSMVMLNPVQYPNVSAVSAAMTAALAYVIENFIIIDFGINDTTANVVSVYNLYKEYKFNRFYTFSGGENVRKANIQDQALTNIQAEHRFFTKLLLAEKVDLAYNNLLQKLHAISGRVNLLDMRKLPITVGSFAQFEVIDNYTDAAPLPLMSMISDVNISLDSQGKFNASISFIGKSTYVEP